MKFFLIDYSELFYKTTAKKKIPRKRAGKFVQLRNNDMEYLLLSPKDFAVYHANIVERFCTEKGIAGTYNIKRDHFEINEPHWEIVGGGIWTINEKEKSLDFSGGSLAYGKFDRRGLREKVLSLKGMSDYIVKTD